jgi:phosphate transport system protein
MTMRTEEITHHYSRQFNEELETLRSNVLEMGGLVEEQLRRGLKALVKGDSDLGEQVVEDDFRVNRMEVSIDEECSQIIARRQPTAGDLRLIITIIKTITDLERIGDEAEKIGFLSSKLAAEERPQNRYRELKHMGKMVREQLHGSLDCLARLDSDRALEIAKEDSIVDEEYEAIMRQSITHMMEDPRTIGRLLDTLWVARALERIGDHAVNICEYVVYLVHGKDIRHLGTDAVIAEEIASNE